MEATSLSTEESGRTTMMEDAVADLSTNEDITMSSQPPLTSNTLNDTSGSTTTHSSKATPYTGQSIVNILPTEILVDIAQHLTIQDVSSLSQTCKAFVEVTNHKIIWNKLLHGIYRLRPLPLPQTLVTKISRTGFSVLDSDLAALMTIKELKETALRATALETKLSLETPTTVKPAKVEKVISMKDPCHWIWFLDGDQYVAIMTESNVLTTWRKRDPVESILDESIVEGKEGEADGGKYYKLMTREEFHENIKPHCWDFDVDDEGFSIVLNMVIDNVGGVERNIMKVLREWYIPGGSNKQSTDIVDFMVPMSVRSNFLEDEIAGCIGGGYINPLVIAIMDWKTNARVLIVTNIFMQVHLTSSSSKDTFMFYKSYLNGGCAYSYTMKYFREVLAEAAAQKDPTEVLIVAQDPEYSHISILPMDDPREPIFPRNPFPTTRRLWNGRRAVMTYYPLQSSSPMDIRLIPDIEDLDTIYHPEIDSDSTSGPSNTKPVISRQPQTIESYYRRLKVFDRPNQDTFQNVSQNWSRLYAIGRGVKHLIWLEESTEGSVRLGIATVPHDEHIEIASSTMPVPKPPVVDAQSLFPSVEEEPLIPPTPSTPSTSEDDISEEDATNEMDTLVSQEYLDDIVEQPPEQLTWKIAPVTLEWEHGDALGGSWLDKVMDIQLDDHFGYLFFACANGDVWRLSFV